MKWAEAPLGKVVRFMGGGTPSKARPEFWQGPIPWVSPKDMVTRDILNSRDHISEGAVTASATQVVPVGSVLIVVRSGILAHTLPIGIARVSLSINQDMKALRPTIDCLSNEYLAYFLQARSRRVLSLCVKRGPTVHSLDVDKLSQIPIPLPTLYEQRRIVEILDHADAIRKKRAEADAKAARILPALFYKLFGDPLTNSMGWDIQELGDLCSVITSGSRGWAMYGGRGNSLFVRTQDVVDGEISSDLLTIEAPSGAEASRTRLQDGDVVVTITGVVGKAAVYRDRGREAYVSQHVALVRTNPSLEPEYLAALANFTAGGTPILARLQYGQTKPGLGFRELRGVRIPLPPIEVQRKFASTIEKVRTIKQSAQIKRERLESLWAGLLHRAFSGNLTAKWRESHMKELLAEMEGQAKALAPRSNENVSAVVKAKRHAGYDMYNKAALAAYIVHRCHEESQPLGRVKLAKLYHLAQSKAKIELTETFAKRAAGPLDDEIFKFLSLAQKNRWVTLDAKQGQLKPVRPGPESGKASEQAAKMLGSTKPMVDDMLDQMKRWSYQTLERWATVLEAVQVIAGAGQHVNVETVKDVIRTHADWVPKLNRQEFSDANIEATLRGLCKLGFVVNLH